MIPRPLRADPREVFAARHRITRFPEAIVRSLASEGAGGIAVVVPKKTARKSVDRHLIKRRYSAALLESRRPGVLLVVTVSALGAGLRGARLRAWCTELWPRILDATHA